jgi:hypothetical protein
MLTKCSDIPTSRARTSPISPVASQCSAHRSSLPSHWQCHYQGRNRSRGRVRHTQLEENRRPRLASRTRSYPNSRCTCNGKHQLPRRLLLHDHKMSECPAYEWSRADCRCTLMTEFRKGAPAHQQSLGRLLGVLDYLTHPACLGQAVQCLLESVQRSVSTSKSLQLDTC